MDKKTSIFLIAVLCISVIAIAIAGVAYQQSQTAKPQYFNVGFTLENTTGAPHMLGEVAVYDITVWKLTTQTLHDVSVYSGYSSGGTTDLQRHYDLWTNQGCKFSMMAPINYTVFVDIYWDGGYQGFYCDPTEK
jgi:hypothetical protein